MRGVSVVAGGRRQNISAGVDKAVVNGVESSVQLSQCFVAGRGGVVLPPLRIFFYIDALNLYYGAVRHTPYRWLDIPALCARLLSDEKNYLKKSDKFPSVRSFEIVGIKFFTANVKPLPWDKGASDRQKLYYKALCVHDTKGMIDIQYGKFSVQKVAAHDSNYISQKHRIIRPEEKGSDVNLALHMLNDAVDDKYDCAVMISNDTDLQTVLSMVRERKKIVGVVFPIRKNRRPSPTLKNNADFCIHVREKHLSACQLPDCVENGKKSYTKPILWNTSKPFKKWNGEYKFGFLAEKFIKTIFLHVRRLFKIQP